MTPHQIANHQRHRAPAMKIRLLKLRYLFAAVRLKVLLFVRQPGAFVFYLRHYAVELRVARNADVVVVSYPKSGRTWLEQLMLAAFGYYSDQCFSDNATYSNVAAESGGNIPLVIFTHAGSSWETALYTPEEIANHVPPNITDRRFVYLYRDPRDVLVSAYYHARYRSEIPWLQPQDMLDDPIVGLPKLVAYMNNWTRQVDAAGLRAIRVTYEALREMPQQTLNELCQFMGLPFSDEEIGKAVDDCSFERLRQREIASSAGNPWLRPMDPGNPDSFKFREGRSGGYKSFFTPEQIAWIEKYMAEHLLGAEEFLGKRVGVAGVGS